MRRPIFFSFGGGQKGDILFFTCSQCVPIMFESGSPSSQVVFQDIPNRHRHIYPIWFVNSHVYKLKRQYVGETTTSVPNDNPIDLGRSLTFS
jgi:hypothetical protein